MSLIDSDLDSGVKGAWEEEENRNTVAAVAEWMADHDYDALVKELLSLTTAPEREKCLLSNRHHCYVLYGGFGEQGEVTNDGALFLMCLPPLSFHVVFRLSYLCWGSCAGPCA